MLSCPNCKSRLARTTTPNGFVYLCGRCGGRAVALSVLRKQASRDFLKILWGQSFGQRNTGRPCPHCGRGMAEVQPNPGESSLTLDVCTRCHVVWFDPKEFAQVPAVSVSARAGEARMSPEAEAALAQEKSHRHVATGLGAWADHEPMTPDAFWKYLPAVLGMPVEVDEGRPARSPLVTWSLSAAMALLLAALLAGGALSKAIAEWGFVPDAWFRHFGLTVPASFLLHGGIFHLVGNLYFFMVFGDNVEETLGPWRFVLLLAGAHVAGMLLHAAADPRGDMPCVGASAGIAGVIACYAVVFPYARIGLFIWFRWLAIPAFVALVLYVGMQSLGTWRQVGGFSHVSYLAHLGGLATGAVVGLLARSREKAYRP